MAANYCFPILLGALMGALALPAALAEQTDEKDDATLKDVVVTATRTETEANTVPATITRVTRQEMDRRQPADETELFEDEPDVAFGRDTRRFGATRPNIRGIEDNRVLQTVDGIRLPYFYNSGGPTNLTMNAPLGPSLEFLRRAEVLRGPASSLYGSDAIGGVVGYFTLDPADLLDPGARFGARTRLGYAGANEGMIGTALAAGRGESYEWLLGVTRTDAHEFDNVGDDDATGFDRTRPNPQEVRDRGALAKFALLPAAGHKLTLAVEGRDQNVNTQVRRLSAALPKASASNGDDLTERGRASLEWEHEPGGGWYERLTARVYYQHNDTENANRQTRSNTSASCSASFGSGNDCTVEQDFSFEQTHKGGALQLESGIGKRHFLVYGADVWRAHTQELRDVRVHNLTTGTFSKSLAGDTFPLRDFAPGYTDTVGVYVQDEIAGFAGGRLTLTPGLRYDWRKLEPEVDALSRQVLDNIGKEAVSQTDAALSPKFAATWQFSPAILGYGLIVRGFRAPLYEEVNGHFRNAVQQYGISPNPNLDPETSIGVEMGMRLEHGGLRGQIAVFDNRYRDFISTERLNCPADPNCIADLAVTFMPVNLSKVRIHGAEARLAWEFAPGWSLAGAVAYAHGTDEEADQPLDTVGPTRAFFALTRDAGAWGAETRLRAAAAVKRVNDFEGDAFSPWFRPPSYEVLDLAAWWKPSDQLRFSLAVNNVFDRKYWMWSDIRLADARDPAGVDFYSQPGRSIAARFEYVF